MKLIKNEKAEKSTVKIEFSVDKEVLMLRLKRFTASR